MNAIYENLTPILRPGRWIAAPVKRSAVRLVHRLSTVRERPLGEVIRAIAYLYQVKPKSVQTWIRQARRGEL